MAKIKQEVTSGVSLEVKTIEGKTYEELVEIARQNNEARRLELLEEDEARQLELLEQEEDKQETNE